MTKRSLLVRIPNERTRRLQPQTLEGIYCPSYLSLEYVLSWHEIIPETVLALTSVSTLKTAVFDTPIGYYSYRHISPNLFFGYKPLQPRDGLPCFMATPEKALLDLLYFHPEYKSAKEYLELMVLDYLSSHPLIGKLTFIVAPTGVF